MNSVPPRVKSCFASPSLEEVWPRSPARIFPLPIAPLEANGLSFAVETLTVIVPAAVSNMPQSALPREVYVREPSELRTAVPKVNVCVPEPFVAACT